MYTLEAILSQYEIVKGALEIFPKAKLIQLPQNIGMIPTDGFLLRELEIYYQGGTKVTNPETQRFSPPVHPDFERLIVGIEKLAQHLSYKGMVAYVEATFTGGYGGHATMIWENGKRASKAGNNINDVLRLLQVIARPDLDEFDTLGLGLYRSTRKWIQDKDS
ncbi:MAG: hypothetical protein A2V66_10500 [Ignavibacteria bacterium RBG_13_36_8]|nr:MAG: hypothetical protein A2V66_10500 [Ignavibacteria bacterium RBG_13_36_8]